MEGFVKGIFAKTSCWVWQQGEELQRMKSTACSTKPEVQPAQCCWGGNNVSFQGISLCLYFSHRVFTFLFILLMNWSLHHLPPKGLQGER